jgi:signal transduction histidine kinase
VGAYLALGFVNGPIFLALPLTAFIAVQPRPLPALRLPLAGGLGLVAAGLVLRVTVQGASAFVTMWQGVGVLALSLAAAAFGGWLHDRRRMREEQGRRAATEEQLRMAQELHDGVGHGLAVIAMNAGAALHLLDKPELDREGVRRSLEAIRLTSRDSLEALRVELSAFRQPAGSANAGSGSADAADAAPRRPVNGLPELDALIERVRTGGLAVERTGDPGPVPEEVGQAVYAVVQESLTNVLRHAEASAAVVSLHRAPGRLLVSVRDDGRGATGATSGMGIPGLRDRLARLEGTLETHSGREGFTVNASIPVER